jgi:hypothetical protein
MSRPKRQMTDEEAKFYAEQIADCILIEWSEGLSAAFAAQMREATFAKSIVNMLAPQFGHEFGTKAGKEAAAFIEATSEVDLATAIEHRDRERLTEFFLASVRYWPKEGAAAILSMLRSFPAAIRGHQTTVSKFAKLKSGRQSKIKPNEYARLAGLGTQLAPLIEKIDLALKDGTKRSVSELLQFWEKDYPEQSTFLNRHHERFQAALRDKRLRKRALRPKSRAAAIADAMAGAEDGLTLSTSYEKAREGRRMQKRKDSKVSAKNRLS